MDPKLSPSNPNIIGFLHHNDVWVSNVTTGQEKQLTWTHSGFPQNSSVEEPISAGVPSFIVQEEFDRYTGYWWKPKIENDDKFCILYEEVYCLPDSLFLFSFALSTDFLHNFV
jgi:hypothetical protein